MHVKNRLGGMVVVASMVLILGSGCASSPGYKNPEVETTKQRTAGTSDELSPLAPVGATNVQRVGNQWTCEQNGRVLIYNDAASRWEPKQ